ARPPRRRVQLRELPAPLRAGRPGVVGDREDRARHRPRRRTLRRCQLLTVANSGHSVLTSTPSSCVARTARSWLSGQQISHSCTSPRLIAPLSNFPQTTRRTTQNATRALGLQQIRETVQEAEAAWLLAMSESGWQPTP